MKRQRLSLKERIDRRVAKARGVDASELEPLKPISERLEESRLRQQELNEYLAKFKQRRTDLRARQQRSQARSHMPASRQPQPAIRAIETHYKGYRFRSRLEARWAVAFTAQGIDWDYEPEGFELPSGRYLPDFWLPQVSMWAEVKPVKPTMPERRLAYELALGSDHPVLLLIGQPDDLAYWAIQVSVLVAGAPAQCDWTDYSPFHDRNYHLSEGRFYSCSSESFRASPLMPFKNECCSPMSPGVAAARSARFEHGESPP